MTYHKTTLPSGEKTWLIDTAVAATVAPWIGKNPSVWQADLAAMARYFPHWIITGVNQGNTAVCETCRVPLVPTDGAFRCLQCQKSSQVTAIQWVGQIPTPVRHEPAFQKALERLRKAKFGEIQIAEQHYLLVPLRVLYSVYWPNQAPTIRYNPRWLKALGIPVNSASHHVIQNGAACIYGSNEWFSQSIDQVIGQRMLNHILSLCKIAAGQKPQQAFIGRVAH